MSLKTGIVVEEMDFEELELLPLDAQLDKATLALEIQRLELEQALDLESNIYFDLAGHHRAGHPGHLYGELDTEIDHDRIFGQE